MDTRMDHHELDGSNFGNVGNFPLSLTTFISHKPSGQPSYNFRRCRCAPISSLRFVQLSNAEISFHHLATFGRVPSINPDAPPACRAHCWYCPRPASQSTHIDSFLTIWKMKQVGEGNLFPGDILGFAEYALVAF